MEQYCSIDLKPQFYSENLAEMSAFEISFLCGLIRKCKPKKVVEVGVAAGGTSIAIYEQLSNLKEPCKMFSVDISEKYYRDFSKNTGFLMEQVKNERKNDDSVSHEFILGKSSAEAAPLIGGNIEVLILDTTHVLPGELLDFLVWLPYLKQDAMVILHDLGANYELEGQKAISCTKLLFDLVKAEKYLMWDKERVMEYPNIGAFKLTSDSRKNIRDLFSCLTLPWEYMLEEKSEIYKHLLMEFYENEYIEIYNKAVGLSEWLLARPKKIEKRPFTWKAKRALRVLIYGR